jgi:hypothetical protein
MNETANVRRINNGFGYMANGARGVRRATFKDRIAAMQMRGTIKTCVKNARREYNRLQRKQLDAMLDEMMPKASDFL